MKRKKIYCVVTLLLLFGISSASAQEEELKNPFTVFTDTFDGYVKHSTGINLDEPDQFTKIYNCLNLRYSDWFGEHVSLTLEGKAVYDAVYDVEDGLDPEDEEDYRAYLDLREATLGLSFENFDLYLGKQQVVWGKTDGFRVTDVVNPLDLRDRASTEFLDQRIPLWMARLEYYFTMEYFLQLLFIPDLEFNRFPTPVFPAESVLHSTKEPQENLENAEYGLKLTGFTKGWDFTLNYLYSWDDMPAFKQGFDTESGTLTVSPEHERLHIVGGTVATMLWDGVLRGEVAAKIGKYFSVDDPGVPEMLLEKTQLSYAFAFERYFFDIQWIAQTLQETVLDYDDRMITDEFQTYATLNGSKTFLRETLEVSAFMLYDVNSDQWRFQPEMEYAYSDPVKLTFGAEIAAGGDELAGEQDEFLYAEVTYSF